MKFTPSSTARRNTRMHSSRSAGGPHTPVPVRRIAPKPSRLIVRSPPRVTVPDAAAICVVTSTTVPAWQAGCVDLQTLEELPLTYQEVGATASGQLPPGYHHLSEITQIGTGRTRFEEAAHSIMRWGMQHGAGLRVQASSD